VLDSLVERAKAGDHDAFEQLASQVASRMYGTAFLIVRDREAAADAVQEALIETWRNLPGLRDAQAFEGWTRKILVRCCYRAIASRRRRIEVRVSEIDAAADSPEARIGAMDQLDRAFRRLSADQRAVLVLHHRLGLPLNETADALNVPLGTVKSRLNRATAALRAALSAEERDVATLERQIA
jgi:RNA polymerase sigma-70 factor, ECF subfamily